MSFIFGTRNDAETFLGILAPFGAAQVDLRVSHFFFALGTYSDRLILPELDVGLAVRAENGKNILRLPELRILSRAFWPLFSHFSVLFFELAKPLFQGYYRTKKYYRTRYRMWNKKYRIGSMIMNLKKIKYLLPLCLAATTLVFSGCGFSPLSYIFSAGVGETHVLVGTVPMDTALNNPNLVPEDHEKLLWVRQVREYAQNTIGLNTGQSYLGFYDTAGNPAIYSMSASSRDALQPKTWSIPVEGETQSLGYFYKNLAQSYADQLKQDGYDTVIYGALAFSTGGFFADPLYSSLFSLDKPLLADSVFHELTHNTIYMANDTEFNESVANFVGKKGALEFIGAVAGKDSAIYTQAVNEEEDRDVVTEFLDGVYRDLEEYYGRTDLSSEEKIARRDQIFIANEEKFTTDYLPRFHDPERMKEWGELPVNNAWILLNRRYNKGMDLFEKVYQGCHQNLNQAVVVFIQATATRDAWQYLQDWVAPN
jgi:predicted aminopeptidase